MLDKYIKKNFFFIFSIAFLLIYFIINYSPNFFSTFEPDSYSYINFTAYRKSLYGIIISICNYLSLDIIFLQKFILSISIALLFYILFIKNNLFISFLITILMMLNFYYTGFSKTVLTESLFMSFVNFSITFLFMGNKSQKSFFYLFAGICFGFLTASKAIGLVLGISFLILMIILIPNKTKKAILFLFIGFLILPLIESIYFHSKHSKRSSVLPQAIIGKTFMISGKENFDYRDFPKKSRQVLEESSKVFKTIQDFLSEIKNPFLKADLSADYEVVAQYQFFKTEINKINIQIKGTGKKFESDFIKIWFHKYFFEYVNISFYHYLGLWSSGAKYIFLEDYIDQKKISIPYQKQLKASSGELIKTSKILLILSLSFFIFLLINFTIITLLSLYFLFKKNLRKKFLLELSLCLITQIYLLSISFSNVATPRYLMPVFPLILISISLFYNKFYASFKKDSVDFSK